MSFSEIKAKEPKLIGSLEYRDLSPHKNLKLSDGLVLEANSGDEISLEGSHGSGFQFLRNRLVMKHGELQELIGALERIEASDGKAGFSDGEVEKAKGKLRNLGILLPDGAVNAGSLFRARLEISKALRKMQSHRQVCFPEIPREKLQQKMPDPFDNDWIWPRQRPDRILDPKIFFDHKRLNPFGEESWIDDPIGIPTPSEGIFGAERMAPVCEMVENSLSVYFSVEGNDMVVSVGPETLRDFFGVREIPRSSLPDSIIYSPETEPRGPMFRDLERTSPFHQYWRKDLNEAFPPSLPIMPSCCVVWDGDYLPCPIEIKIDTDKGLY